MKYNKDDITSIVTYAKKLEGKTFLEILKASTLDEATLNFQIKKYGNPRRKGGLGNLLEEVFFEYKANSDSQPDFYKVGVELKVSPYEITKKKELRAGERLVLTMIDYNNPIEKDLFSSHLWEKIKKVLLIYYLRNRAAPSNLDYRIDYTSLFSPNEEDLAIIIDDYCQIIKKIESGKAHELSESDTIYLSACTKGATAEKSLVSQYYNKEVKAKKRAFAFKQSYMHSVLNSIALSSTSSPESIVKNKSDLMHTGFENLVLNKLASYYGKSDAELCKMFNREYNNNKAQWVDLTYRMLGIKSNQALEFTKANIVVKTIRVEEDGKVRESLSFPSFKFKEIIHEEWEDSTIFRYFNETKFLFAIYKKEGDKYIFQYAKLWNMPMSDLEGDVQNCWKETVKVIKSGIKFKKVGKRISNNLPSSKENRIMHVRPHATKSAYKLYNLVEDNNEKDNNIYTYSSDSNRFYEASPVSPLYEVGDIKKNANELPDGQWMTHQSFWINNSYVIDEILKKS